MRRGLVIVALALAGCAGAEPERGEVMGAAHPREARWATPGELRWLGRVFRWSEAFGRAGADVAEFESAPGFERALQGDAAALGRYRRVLAPIRSCSATFRARVGRAPTERLRDSERGFLDSCARYREGVDLMLRALGEQDAGLAARARVAIEEAAARSGVASGQLPPGEKQELPRRGGAARASRVEPRLSHAAGRIAEKPVEVRCWSERDWRSLMREERAFTGGKVNASVLGFASAGGARLSLAPAICRDLVRLVYAHERPRTETERLPLAVALVTLAHESVHVAGRADEPTAECHGLQLAADAARALGVGSGFAAELVGLYWERYDEIPALYRSPECRDGGELDLHAARARFP